MLVLQNAGPVGAPGMPEVGFCRSRSKLLERGVRDMVRISDARMSGTAYGTIVLHVAPESAVGGPLALVRDGDAIVLDVPGRGLDAGRAGGRAGPAPRRLAAARAPQFARGYRQALPAARPPGAARLRLRLSAAARGRSHWKLGGDGL